MVISYGTNSKPLTEVPTSGPCSSCQSTDSVVLIPHQKYFHIFFIPIFPLGKEYEAHCKKCGATMPASLHQIGDHSVKTPIWTFSGPIIGIALLCLLFIIGTFGMKGDQSKLKDPQVGDIYEYRDREAKQYGLIKVDSVSKDSVYIVFNKYVIDKRKGLKQLLKENLSDFEKDSRTSVARNKLLEEHKNGFIIGVVR